MKTTFISFLIVGLACAQTVTSSAQIVTSQLVGNEMHIHINYASIDEAIEALQSSASSSGLCIPLTVPLDTALGTMLYYNWAIQGKMAVVLDATDGSTLSETLLLAENNLRIRFKDTSSSALFPTTDWEIQANSNLNGGESYFGIVDVDAGVLAFAVEASTGDSALVVQSDGTIKTGGLKFPDQSVQTVAVPAPATGSATLGTMMYWDGSGWIHIAPGSDGETLTWCNGTPIWGACPN